MAGRTHQAGGRWAKEGKAAGQEPFSPVATDKNPPAFSFGRPGLRSVLCKPKFSTHNSSRAGRVGARLKPGRSAPKRFPALNERVLTSLAVLPPLPTGPYKLVETSVGLHLYSTRSVLTLTRSVSEGHNRFLLTASG